MVMDLLSSAPKDSLLGCLFNPLETIKIVKFKKDTAWPQSDLSVRSLLQEAGQMYRGALGLGLQGSKSRLRPKDFMQNVFGQ